MESPPTSKCVATARGDNGQEPVRNGIRMDGQWEHQRIRQGPQRRESI